MSSGRGKRSPWAQAQRWPRQDGPWGHAPERTSEKQSPDRGLLRNLNGTVVSQAPEPVILSHHLVTTYTLGGLGLCGADKELSLPCIPMSLDLASFSRNSKPAPQRKEFT